MSYLTSKKLQHKTNYLIGVISYTHGFLPPWAVKTFQGTDLIIHAGDIGKPDILKTLQTIAPVVAVQGNMDYGEWTDNLAQTEVVEVVRGSQDTDIQPLSLCFKYMEPIWMHGLLNWKEFRYRFCIKAG